MLRHSLAPNPAFSHVFPGHNPLGRSLGGLEVGEGCLPAKQREFTDFRAFQAPKMGVLRQVFLDHPSHVPLEKRWLLWLSVDVENESNVFLLAWFFLFGRGVAMVANLRSCYSCYSIEADVWISTLDSVIITSKAHQNNIARDERSIVQKLEMEIGFRKVPKKVKHEHQKYGFHTTLWRTTPKCAFRGGKKRWFPGSSPQSWSLLWGLIFSMTFFWLQVVWSIWSIMRVFLKLGYTPKIACFHEETDGFSQTHEATG